MNSSYVRALVIASVAAVSPVLLTAQTAAQAKPAVVVPPWQLSPEERQRIQKLTDEDHADMLAQLGIKVLRSGKNGSPAPGTPNAANYDQAKANPFPDWPDALTLKNGTKVTTAATRTART